MGRRQGLGEKEEDRRKCERANRRDGEREIECKMRWSDETEGPRDKQTDRQTEGN